MRDRSRPWLPTRAADPQTAEDLPGTCIDGAQQFDGEGIHRPKTANGAEEERREADDGDDDEKRAETEAEPPDHRLHVGEHGCHDDDEGDGQNGALHGHRMCQQRADNERDHERQDEAADGYEDRGLHLGPVVRTTAYDLAQSRGWLHQLPPQSSAWQIPPNS